MLGTVYGGGKDPLSFQVDARMLRGTLAHAGAVIDLAVDGSAAEPVVLKERQRHPVSGQTLHVDLLRVDLSKPIQAQVVLELTEIEESDARTGGVLEHAVREITVEALPAAVPDVIQHSVAGLTIGKAVTLGDLVAPPGTRIIGDPDQVLATIHAARGLAGESGEEGEVELETGLVSESAGADNAGSAAH